MLTTATDSGLTLDVEQLAAVDALAQFGATVLRHAGDSERQPSGLYLWGTVGRGKTWLADAFFAAIAVEPKRRLHFHSFYRQLQRDLYRGDGPPPPGAIDTAIDELLDGVELLFFDEFHLHDAGDATLALRMLKELADRGVPLLATSNYAPAALLPDPMYHHLFARGTALIEDVFTVVPLGGDTDYRRMEQPDEVRSGFARGSWQVPGLKPRPEPEESTQLHSGGHTFIASRADRDELWFTFSELCESPTTAGDYLAWAEQWRRWVVEAVPRLTDCTPQARQRFLNLIDVLNDRGVETTFISHLSPEQVLEGGRAPTARGAAADREELGLGLDGLPIDVARTASRLALLRRIL
ncbi:cell division protein ZapE [Homoserinimonas aerilata]|uniref:Cell division protein ZapE n=2 Tax=Homoserinimonas aerilata TaxID=1162970 RepID=A0A542YI45_9MICO|nr:cell division protein ZapE [Homoserinimonas aerilata]